MRIAFLIALGWTLATPLLAAADDDDPKGARGAEPVTSAAPSQPVVASEPSVVPRGEAERPPAKLDEDDPKLARGLSVSSYAPRKQRPVPRVKLAYRRLSSAGLEGGTIDFNVISFDYYPSSGIFRLGMDAGFGWGADPYSSWFFVAGAAVGVQYPWRVTPFLEGRFEAGFQGGSFMGQSAVSWVYMGGIDTGIEVYVAGRFYLSAAIGWVHPVFSGIDVEFVKSHPTLDPERKEFANDSFTFKFGIGL